ncbi:acyltransferase [Erwinia sp. JH02]|uniref:acyltransferase family protein n=1 Tax=Erwinia sp. JH02 TaxID=2733394 RepID=UPI001488F1C5|nr:acyltransferase [Erwinia sp. JH02]NNS08070.1 acyltransferase [Erwinia sp. JH02]
MITQQTKINKIESLQILRGLAALAVVMFHYRFRLVENGASMVIPNKLLGWGSIGVDLFFVISGFIMVYVTYNKPHGLKSTIDFAFNRLTRIIPTYYIILLITFFISGAMSIFHYTDKTENLISALTFMPYLLDPAPLYIDGNGMFNVRWTLNYELYFYLIFSLCLLVRFRMVALACWFIAPVFIAWYLFPQVSFSTKGYHFNSVMARFLTNPLILEFGMGILTGYIYLYLKDRASYLSLIPPALIISLTAYGIYSGELKGYSLLSGMVFSVVILIFALYNNAVIKITPGFFIMLGNISFSWYLTHVQCGAFLSKKIEKTFPGATYTAAGFLSLLLLSIFIAFLSHRYIEIKLTKKLRLAFKKSMKNKNKGTIS